MSEEQTEAAAIESLKGLIPDDGYNIGQAEEPEANPSTGAEPKKEEPETKPEEKPVEEGADEAAATDQTVDEDVEIEIDGQSYKVPPRLKDSFMKEKDYRQKTMEIAELRKTLEAEKGKVDPNTAQELARYQQLLSSAVQADQQRDWVKFAQEDPIGYLVEKEKAEQRYVKNAQIQAQQNREFAVNVSQAAEKEWGQLTAKRPDLKDAAAFKAHDEKVRTFLSQQGYESKDIDSAVFDHRVRLLVEEVIKYRELQTAKTETAKIITKLPPKIERPGVPSGTDGQASKAAMQQLRKSGSLDDGAAAIRAMMG